MAIYGKKDCAHASSDKIMAIQIVELAKFRCMVGQDHTDIAIKRFKFYSAYIQPNVQLLNVAAEKTLSAVLEISKLGINFLRLFQNKALDSYTGKLNEHCQTKLVADLVDLLVEVSTSSRTNMEKAFGPGVLDLVSCASVPDNGGALSLAAPVGIQTAERVAT